jgi:hypothetical protein
MHTTPDPDSTRRVIEPGSAATVVGEPATQPPHAPGQQAAQQPPDPPEDELGYEDWEDEPEAEFLPPRPRSRLLRPMTVLLFAALTASAGFLGGVLIEKHQLPSTTSSVSARLAAGSATAATGAGRGATTGGSGAAATGAGRGATGASGAVVGQVSTVAGSTLYVTDSSGNTIKVTTSTAQITKTQSTTITAHGVHAGDSVVIEGKAAASGTVAATAVRDSGTTGSAGGVNGLFGSGSGQSSASRQSSTSTNTSTATSTTGGTSGPVNSLFGQ